jgi:hypothetical protein
VPVSATVLLCSLGAGAGNYSPYDRSSGNHPGRRYRCKGNPVDGISASNFVLLDDGKPRAVNVDVLESGIAPISLVAVVQTSNMSLAAIGKTRRLDR